ncbi:MAG: spermidine synthase [Fimbriiglobus sp.]
MPVLFAVTLFTSATLLFMVQPMVGKMILPYLGGSPAAWNTCMVFFQGLLLLGYLYADRLTARVATKRQVVVHLGVLLATLGVFGLAVVVSPKHTPIAVFKTLAPQGEAYPMFGVLLLLGVAVGLPFLVVSTSAPLLQRWFTYTRHPAADDPYFLYAASNAGSLISLLGYPLFVEPTFKVATQAWLWAGGFVVLTGLVYLCGQAAANPLPPQDPKKKAPAGPAAKLYPRRTRGTPTLARKLRWMGLAFVPSSLMLGVTFHMTTDIASVPLLWVIPLALYLLTFIIAYAKTAEELWWYRPVLVNFAPVMILLLVFVMSSKLGGLSAFVLLSLHLAAYFVTALLMHSELADMRPDDTEHLTGYFLWISIGGVVGGMFNALVAPIAFPQTWEYPIALVIACLLVPPPDDDGPAPTAAAAADPVAVARKRMIEKVLDGLVPLGMLVLVSYLLVLPEFEWFRLAITTVAVAVTGGLQWCGINLGLAPDTIRVLVMHALPCMLCFLFIDRPRRFGLCVAAILGGWVYWTSNAGGIQTTERSFFGILRVEETTVRPDVYLYGPPADFVAKEGEKPPVFVYRHPVPLRQLTHGTTLHGIQGAAQYMLPVRDNFPAVVPDPWAALTNTAMAGVYATTRVVGPDGKPVVGPDGKPDLDVEFFRGAYDFRQDPLTYYHRTGPVGDAFRVLRAKNPGGHVGMIGLGTGSVACYAQPGQKLTFYEIDPTVMKLVVDTDQYFTFVADAKKRGAQLDFVLGDARLQLEKLTDARYALLLVDAFSSDSIPVHLLTREAMELYRDRLTDHGLLVIHISNRYISLDPVVARLAKETGLVARMWSDDEVGPPEGKGQPGKTRSSWILLAKKPEDLGDDVLGTMADERLAAVAGGYAWAWYNHRWVPPKVLDDVPAWTDDYSDVLRVMRLKEVQRIRRFFGLPTPITD